MLLSADDASQVSETHAQVPAWRQLLMPLPQAHTARGLQMTLFIMPHCERHLYEAVLTANEEAGTLQRTAILGNSFAEYGARLLLSSAPTNGLSPLLRFLEHTTGAPPVQAWKGGQTYALPRGPSRLYACFSDQCIQLYVFALVWKVRRLTSADRSDFGSIFTRC